MSTDWTAFVEPAGGMMALLPITVARRWKGAEGPEGEESDYDKLADAVGFYVSIREVYGETCVLFAGDRTRMSWRVEGERCVTVLRILCSTNEEEVLTFASRTPDLKPNQVTSDIGLTRGDYQLVDISESAEECEGSLDRVRLKPGIYQLATWEVTFQDGTEFLVHRLELTS